jgi:pimeloyl-ACP methyl ester carboxylesterase
MKKILVFLGAMLVALVLFAVVITRDGERVVPEGEGVVALDVPAELVWGMNDPILAKTLPLMRRSFPNAPLTETEGGHFLQEEVPVEIAAALLRVVDQVQAPGPPAG